MAKIDITPLPLLSCPICGSDLALGYCPNCEMKQTPIAIPMNDNGQRESFGVGAAIRESLDNKSRPELISPFALHRLGLWTARGAVKYAERNWERGMKFTRYIGAILRHTIAYMLRKDDEDHLAAIMWNAQALIHHEECGQTEQWDDRPYYGWEDCSHDE